MASAIQAAAAIEATPARRAATRWTPLSIAFALTLGLRLFYSLIAALASPYLTLDLHLIQRNALTDHLMSRGAHPVLYAVLGVWERFDTLWYIRIARHGYDAAMATVFYPLYPALIRAASLAVRSDLLSAVLISTVAAFFLFWGALRLFELDYSRDVSLRAVMLWAAWPASFIFFAGYADSLLCALIVWSVYFARSERWGAAGALGLLAGLTKALGCFVALPLAWLAWKRRSWAGAAAAAVSAAGTACFEAWLAARHFPSAAEVYRTWWATSTTAPWISLRDALAGLLHGGNALLIFNLGAFAAVAAMTLAGGIRFEYRIYSLAALCLFLTKHTEPLLQSTTRYTLAVFATYPGLCMRFGRGLGYAAVVYVAAVLNLFLFVVFLNWSLVV